jgi:hypothetical protein
LIDRTPLWLRFLFVWFYGFQFFLHFVHMLLEEIDFLLTVWHVPQIIYNKNYTILVIIIDMTLIQLS